jgi:ring-1,2-phenylacetyl-CoA epoxidase subunit PaaE
MESMVQTVLLAMAGEYLKTALMNAVLLTSVFFLVWKLFGRALAHKRVQFIRRAGGWQIRREIQHALVAMLVAMFYGLLIMSLYKSGHTALYTDISERGVAYAIATFFGMWLFDDAWFYWVHRLSHHPKVYKYMHALHHESLDVTPYSSLSFHLLEPLLLTFWVIPVALFVPVALPVLGVLQVVGLFNNIKSHLGYELYPQFFQRTPFKWLVTATHHSLHHTRYNGNYGLHFRFWDVLCKTEMSDYRAHLSGLLARKPGAEISHNTDYKPLTIVSIHHETANVCSVVFSPADDSFLCYLPGQHLNLRIRLGGVTFLRTFSLSSSPGLDAHLRITVQLNGPVSHYFFHDARVGDNVDALAPCGDFTVEPHPRLKRQFLMVAGGTGITPLMSMIRSLIAHESQSKIVLLYACKTREAILFKTELAQLSSNSSALEVRYFFSNEQRMLAPDVQQAARQLTHPLCFVCGPDSLKRAVKTYLADALGGRTAAPVAPFATEEFASGYLPLRALFNRTFFKRRSKSTG